MIKTKEEYESAINYASILSINCEENLKTYAIEERKFIALVVEYLYSINPKYYENYSVELIDTIKACLKNYTVEAGLFLHYYHSSLKKTISRSFRKSNIDEKRTGIKIGSKNDKLTRSIFRYAAQNGKDVKDENFIEMVSKALDLPISSIYSALAAANNSITLSAVRKGEDGEAISLFNILPSGYNLESDYESRENLADLLALMQSLLESLQDRVRNKTRDIITADILKSGAVEEFGEDFIRNVSFLNIEHVDNYCTTAMILSCRQIAEIHGVVEQDISRARKNFYLKIRNHLL